MAYKYSDAVNNAAKKKKEAEEAVSNYGIYTSPYAKQMDNIYNKIMNRKDFSYDVNGDALYQQYKANAIKNGQLAMQNTMGQAAALTGGWGNSYAVTAGQQAFNDSMTALADRVPELYNLALQRYNAEGDRLNNMYALASDRDATNYGRWSDQYGRLLDNRNYYGDTFNNERSFDYGKFSDDRNYSLQEKNYSLQEQAQKLDQEQLEWQKYMDQLNYELQKKNISSSKSSGSSGGSRSKSSSGSSNSGSIQDGGTVTPTETDNADKYTEIIPTRARFNQSRSRNEYEGYHDYIDKELKYLRDNGDINDGEYAWLVQFYEDK